MVGRQKDSNTSVNLLAGLSADGDRLGHTERLYSVD